MKKLNLCFFITLFVSMSLFSDGVQPTGSGTESAPYQVATLDNLLWISTNDISWDKHFIQIDDIDASDTQNWNEGEGFSPIGISQSNDFSGSYNGNDHTIDWLYINRYSNYYQGLFGFTHSATIENLGITNVIVCGDRYVGGLVGYNFVNSNINNCYSTGSISVGSYEAGGLVG
ncbi:MAG: hypothetical protein K8S23_12730 [Candidatus Cloacimonetes bacterium]|nr:hypothetical protein [Candidatus Cloacimonadota bacterium]